VRPLTDQTFEIIAGAKRYRAAQMAEAPTVRVRIVNLTDAEALEAQLKSKTCDALKHGMGETRFSGGRHSYLRMLMLSSCRRTTVPHADIPAQQHISANTT
jgi:hypothetical protein